MRHRFLRCAAVVAIWSLTSYAVEGPLDPQGEANPDQAAEKALTDLQRLIDRGEVGWWRSEADPVIQFLNRYTGLGGDTATVLSLNQMEALWPAWKTMGAGLENFGIACSVYNCLNNAYYGNYQKAVIEGLKDFLKYRVSKIGSTGAVAASGVGLIDFALNSFGEAATAKIKDDFWWAYCRYQAEQHPSLRSTIDLIVKGDGTRKGMAAVNASLDSFWIQDPYANGMVGEFNLKANDPNYQQTFRGRYLKENILPFLQQWAEHERDKAEFEAYRAARKFAEDVLNTKLAVELSVIEKGLGTAPKGCTAEWVVRQYSPKDVTTVLATAPLTAPVRFEVPLSMLLSEDKRLARSVMVWIRRPGATQEPRMSSDTNFQVDLAERGQGWVRTAQSGRLLYRADKPFYVSYYSEVSVTLEGEAQALQEIRSLRLDRIPPVTARNVRDLTRMPGGESSVSLQNGKGSVRLEHGRYLISARSGDYVFCEGPVTIDGPRELSVTARRVNKDETTAPAAPDAGSLQEQLARAITATRSRLQDRTRWLNDTASSLQDYWQQSLLAIYARDRAERALEVKLQDEVRQPGLTSEQQQAIYKSYRPRIDEIRKGTEETRRALSSTTNASSDEAYKLEQEQQKSQTAARNEMNASRDDLRNILNALQREFYPIESGFQRATRDVADGAWMTMPADRLDTSMAEARAALADVENHLPTLLKEYEKLPAAAERYTKAVAAMQEIEVADGVTLYHNPDVFDDEMAMLSQRIEVIRNSKLLEEAKAMVEKGERMVARRRARTEKVQALVRQIEAAIQEMPQANVSLWAQRREAFAGKADGLFRAAIDLAGQGGDDTAAFVSLTTEMDAFLAQEAAVCGDLLQPPAKTETAFGRFMALYEQFNDFDWWVHVQPDFWQQVMQPGWKKVTDRGQAVGQVLALREELRRWLALGSNATLRRQKRTAALAVFQTGEMKSIGEELAAVESQAKVIDSLPMRVLPPESIAVWQAARQGLARSGKLEAFLRQQGRPFLVFKTVNKQPYGKAYLWPEAVPAGGQSEGGIEVDLGVEGVTDPWSCTIQSSYDGKSWSLVPGRGQWRTYLSYDPKGETSSEMQYRVTYPPRQETHVPGGIPQYGWPKSSIPR